MRTLIPERLSQRPVALGMIASGLAAICYGTSQYIARQLVTQYDHALVIASMALFAGLVILSSVTSQTLVKDRHAPRRAVLFMILSGFAASAGVAFSFSALRLAPVVIVAPISSVTPLISLALAHIFLRSLEKITRRTWLGALLVVAGIILVTLGSR